MQNGSYMQVRHAQSGRLLGYMFVGQASRRYDGVKFVASNPPRLASWRRDPKGADPTSTRFFVIHLRFAEWEYADGRVERVLTATDDYRVEDLLKTQQFIPVQLTEIH